ncbi:MAG: hypothetical protein DRN99_07705 [Thermoproteota archaeon]|nr:MAG: hypothetical protein DRN99_07705 [Candidatus Korarchaeota archaeon]
MPYADVGVKLYYEEHGRGKPIVLLSWILGGVEDWRPQIEWYAGFRAVAVELRGQGRSGKPRESYSMERHCRDLEALAAELELRDPILIGVGYGGAVALLYAARNPVRGVVAACSACRADRPLKARVDRWIMAARFRSGRYLFQAVYPDVYSDSFLKSSWSRVEAEALRYERIDFDAFLELAKSFRALDISGELPGIEAPVLVAAAEEDKLLPVRYSRQIAELIPSSRLEVLGGVGHLAHIENPSLFSKLALKFMREVS